MTKMDDSAARVSELIKASQAGNAQAASELIPLVYDQLRAYAQDLMSRERTGHTVQATALVHEAYLRLAGSGGDAWDGRLHFFNAAARTMRRILIDHAIARKAKKRGGDRRREPEDLLSLIDIPAAQLFLPEEMAELDEALEALEAHNPRWAQIVHLRFFAGLAIDETAEVMHLSPATIKNDWRFARAWLVVRVKQASEARSRG
jgi:RNA polymerase sigma factor (TIGR02999 family)